MNYMEEILVDLKKRPGLYATDEKLEHLRAFINGYMYRKFQDTDDIPEFYPGFQKYVEEFYHVTTGQHWSKIIDFYSNSHHEAMNKFFQHLDAFTECEKIYNSK